MLDIFKNLSSFGFGVVSAVAFTSSQNVDLYAAFEHIENGVRELASGLAIIGPITIGAVTAYRKARK